MASGYAEEREWDVLIVDDATSVRQTVARILEDLGIPSHRIHRVETARDAMIFCDAEAPDVVLLDLVLPDIPGEEVGPVLMEENPRMRVVPMTALDPEDGRVRQMVAMGAFDVIEKPVRRGAIEKLFAELREEGQIAEGAER